MCNIQTPDALFGVTANHVLTIYERHRAEHADVFCQLGSGPFEPTENVIDRSEHWDLVSNLLNSEKTQYKLRIENSALKQGLPINSLGASPSKRRRG